MSGCGCQACASRGIGDLLPTIVWPSDVKRKKDELDVYVRGLDQAFDSCQHLSAEQAVTYDHFSRAWRSFYEEEVGVFGSANKWDEALQYQDTIRGWQDTLKEAGCTAPGPLVKPPDRTSSEEILSTVKTVAVVGGVIAGVVLLAPVVYDFVAARRLARPARSR